MSPVIQFKSNQNLIFKNSQLIVAALSILGTFFILSWTLKYCAYGIDFTDEGFHLVWISNPFIYDFSITQFGFIYHPLYLLLKGDIVLLRQANILITFSLAWCLTHTFFTYLVPKTKKWSFTSHIAASGLAVSSLSTLIFWLTTPNYNNLTLQALLITSIGLLLASKKITSKSIFGWLIIGLGGWLTFMAKPSSALILAVSVFFYILISRKFSIRLLLLAIMSSLTLLLISAFFIDGSILKFTQRVQLGLEFVHNSNAGYSLNQIFRLDKFLLTINDKLTIFIIFIMSFFGTYGVRCKKQIGLLISLSMSFMFFLYTSYLTLRESQPIIDLGLFKGLLVYGLVFSSLLVWLLEERGRIFKSTSLPKWPIAFLFFIMPHIYAFGTNGNYWMIGGGAGIFWVLASITLLGPAIRKYASWSLIMPLVLATQTVTAVLLHSGAERPYRQPQPLRLNKTRLVVSPQQSILILPIEYATYITTSKQTAQSSGFTPGTPIIDLTGLSPGLLFLLGAESIGQAWTIGAYPGSLQVAKAALSLTPCEKIATAWILLEPDGPRSISTEILTNLGAAFPEEYKHVGTWNIAKGAGGYTSRRTQELYKPIASNKILKSCKSLRKAGKE